MATGVTFNRIKPITPIVGDMYVDTATYHTYIWDGINWLQYSADYASIPKDYTPTSEQLDNHPSLKAAWEEYMVIRKLLGL